MWKVLSKIEIPKEESEFTVPSTSKNNLEQGRTDVIFARKDLAPVPPLPDGPRTWGKFHLIGFWLAEAASISQYQVASTSVQAGLSTGAAIGAVVVGHFLVSVACALNGVAGCATGLNFPVLSSTGFGIRGAYVAVICRAAAAIIWFGTQTYQGGQCVQVMIGAIWPSFHNFENKLPASANVTSSQLLCFFLFYIIQLPLLYIHISKLRYFFMIKAIIIPIFFIVLFGWAIGRANGFGPIFDTPTKITDGRPAAVVFFSAMSAAIAPKATLALNISDFTRYAKKERDVAWTNIFTLTILVTLCAALGPIVTSAAQVIYGVSTWNPLEVARLWNNRAAEFFAGLIWAVAILGTNISANSTAVGNDLSLLFPRWINIRRGQYICAILGLATTPWNIQNKAQSFLAFLSGYSVWLGPICGILVVDYWILSRRYIAFRDLYVRGEGAYWYSFGFNWRAIVAFVLSLVPNFPGLVLSIGGSGTGVPPKSAYVYCCVWPVGTVISGVIYYTLNKVFPSYGLTEAKNDESFGTASPKSVKEEASI